MTTTHTFPNELFFDQATLELQLGNRITVLIKGQSMWPMIRGGKDRVVIEPWLSEPIHRGDLYLFRFEQHYRLHRLVGYSSDHSLIMLGDGNVTPELISRSQILGRVSTILKENHKTIRTESLQWLIFSRIWQLMLPLRPYLMRFKRDSMV